MDTADNECPRLSHMVPQWSSGAGEEPALPFGKSFPFLLLLRNSLLWLLSRSYHPRFVFTRLVLVFLTPVCSLPDVVLD